MAASTANKIYDNSTDNNFKSWAKAISDALLAFGWTKTADTGQIDWDAVGRPTTSNGIAGYEVWAMGDTLQATAPVYLKIEYGAGNSSALHPMVWLTLGTGTGGTGTLTGTLTERRQLVSGGNTATATPCRFSGASNRFVACLAPEFNNAANMIAFGIERTHNTDGSDNDTAAVLFGVAGTATKFIAVLPKSGTGPAPTTETGFGAVMPLVASSVRGTDIGLFPVFPFLGKMLQPLKNCLLYFNSEITSGMVISADHYAGPMSVYTVGGGSGSYARGTGTDATNSRLAIRYE